MLLRPKEKILKRGCESDSSYKSDDYHPRRTKKYSVDAVWEDKDSADDTPMMKKLRDFRHRSIELTKNNVNQFSDMRLLSLDCIYLFSENFKESVTKYLETDRHISSIPSFSCGKPNDIDPIAFKWCMGLTNFKFEDYSNRWMELKKSYHSYAG